MLTNGTCIRCDKWMQVEKPHLPMARKELIQQFPVFLIVVDGKIAIVRGYQPHGVIRSIMKSMRQKPKIVPVPIPDPVPNQLRLKQ